MSSNVFAALNAGMTMITRGRTPGAGDAGVGCASEADGIASLCQGRFQCVKVTPLRRDAVASRRVTGASRTEALLIEQMIRGRLGEGVSRLLRIALLPLAAVVVCTGCERQGPDNLIVILVDTLRADHLGCYGYPRGTSPNIDAMAADSVVFENAIAQSSWTAPSVASLFTSTYPSSHHVTSFTALLPASLPTLASVLQERGYETAAVSANFVHVTSAKGFAQGFKTFSEVAHKPLPGETEEFLGLVPGTAREVTDSASVWLDRHHTTPFFLYVHYMDTHSSYRPPPEFRARFSRPYDGAIDGSTDQIKKIERGELSIDEDGVRHLVDLYDAEIAFTDEQIGRLLAKVRALGVYGKSTIVVVADHGEEFHDHGGLFHGLTLYREMIRVPLIIHPARAIDPAARRAEIVELIDVGPTLLDLLGIADTRRTQGTSFAQIVRDRRTPTSWRNVAHSELFQDPLVDAALHPKKHANAVVSPGWWLLAAPTGAIELYRAIDVSQKSDRAEDESSVTKRLVEDLNSHREATAGFSAVPSSPGTLRQEDRERLRALGYLD